MDLTSKQRKYLRGLAHPLEPVVRVGKAQITDSLVAETDRSLQSHELIKVRIEVDDGDARRRLAGDLATRTGAAVAGTIGKIAILYRPREDEPEIRLPER